MTIDDTWQKATAHLTGAIGAGRVLIPTDSRFNEAVRVWNGAVRTAPGMVVRCGTASDVQQAVIAAREGGLPISVKSGGHDWSGRSVRSGSLVIDLSVMRHVTVDRQAQTATMGGGTTAADLINVTKAHGLVTATGTSAAVSMAGLAMGGGYGPGIGKYGLALDNIVSAQVVLADGRLVEASETSEPELLWAIKGGGGNFGVVTSLTMRLHPLDTALAGFMILGPHEAGQVWTGLEEILADAPDELAVDSGFISAPDGNPAILISPTWLGDHATGQAYVDRLSSLGTVFASQIGPTPWPGLISFVDTIAPAGRQYHVRTRNIAGFTGDVVSALVEAGSRRTSPLSTIPLHCFRGVATRVASDATAFELRRPHFMVEIIGSWTPEDEARADEHRAWVQETAEVIGGIGLPGGYVNLLGPDETDRAADAFGDNTSRLMSVKQKYDPENTFDAVPLPRG